MQRLLAVIILSTLIMTPLFAEEKSNKNIELKDSDKPEIIESTRGPIISGNYKYVRDNHGLKIFDISNPRYPVLVGKHETYYDMGSMIINEKIAYISTSALEFNFFVFDLFDPTNPILVDQADLKGNPRVDNPAREFILKMYITNGLFCVVTDKDILHILDISNPYIPLEIDSINGFKIADLHIKGDSLFTSNNISFRISDRVEECQARFATFPKEFSIKCSCPSHLEKTINITVSQPPSRILRIGIYNLSGDEVKVLGTRKPKPGLLDFVFDGTKFPDGIYIIKATSPSYETQIQKVVLTK